ncbi:ArsR family transcriptional regulator [Haloferax mediterranei ATCC 33500]|uniref:ArsR family regulatory protein n=1 Tax=Haloferax mediterranei (strain ATCC 33500 / DSM 1411 / JCM 8866 / NBRC 14739 / NCIMB 2177 / R-4) TaxID=523841 RepID=I3R510_HALMT|nr:winged helix-turn-helix domain-containing protein [Haloferax mediterranei]AFK19320.1 ArsR family regulatory protein [Haloferax mediterranei ATCC 33500]AHZ21324.1 ArsR family transcriptional regulator [Haloferax mediterranei ATCC 33500]EMA04491.1 ArsR family regulatory protein [Haloferax mediterranei ATCC 33500]MDX5989423.1 winged helix-turn-helix domain-containing protein [Haloferax mediterranei ATCC 33500]QCQ75788.1 ArsR family transcriptional regulator [Haloferax mediterranei ATCC 33500]
MAGLLPSAPDTSAADEPSPRVIGLDDDEASELLSALSSETARRALALLHEEPTNAAELAERVDTSLQNVQYHLGKLDDAGLIEVVDTVYSEKGREMKVYAPADRPLVVVAAAEETRTGLASMVTSLLGGVAVLGLLAALVQWVATRGPGGLFPVAETGSSDGAVTMAAESAPAAAQSIPPGIAFFAGGLVILLAIAIVQFARYRAE